MAGAVLMPNCMSIQAIRDYTCEGKSNGEKLCDEKNKMKLNEYNLKFKTGDEVACSGCKMEDITGEEMITYSYSCRKCKIHWCQDCID